MTVGLVVWGALMVVWAIIMFIAGAWMGIHNRRDSKGGNVSWEDRMKTEVIEAFHTVGTTETEVHELVNEVWVGEANKMLDHLRAKGASPVAFSTQEWYYKDLQQLKDQSRKVQELEAQLESANERATEWQEEANQWRGTAENWERAYRKLQYREPRHRDNIRIRAVEHAVVGPTGTQPRTFVTIEWPKLREEIKPGDIYNMRRWEGAK